MLWLDASYCKATNRYSVDLMKTFLRGACKSKLSDPRERETKHCHRSIKAWYPVSFPFVGGPNPASLILISNLSSKHLSIKTLQHEIDMVFLDILWVWTAEKLFIFSKIL